jgi:hypothetical protein
VAQQSSRFYILDFKIGVYNSMYTQGTLPLAVNMNPHHKYEDQNGSTIKTIGKR